MPDRTYVYKVEVDSRSAGASAAQARTAIQRELSQVRFTPQAQASGGATSGGGTANSGIGDLARQTIGGVAVGVLTRQVVRTAMELDTLATSYRRTSVAAVQLAGSQEKVNELLKAYGNASGGAVDKATALQQIAKLQAIGFADTAEELERFTRAARGASLATNSSNDYVISQMQLAIANKSTMRLDQIGIGVSEFNARENELKGSMRGASEEMVYQEALLSLMEEKYGALARSAEGAATGQELFNKQVADGRLELAQTVSKNLDPYFRGFAVGMGSESLDNFQAIFKQRLQQTTNNTPAGNVTNYTAAQQAIEEFNKAIANGDTWVEQYRDRLVELSEAAAGNVDPQGQLAGELEELIRIFALASNGGIVLAKTQEDIGKSAAYAAGHVFELAAGLFQVGQNGQLVKVPALGPATQPPSLPNQNAVEGMFSGGLLGSSLQGPGAFQKTYGSAYRQNQEEERQNAERESESEIRENERVAREAQSAFESAATATERAFRDAAGELESSLRAIPGLFGRSDVTKEQGDMAKLGVSQNFADNYLRRLTDEVLNGVDWANVSLADASSRAGIDQSLDPKAQLAIFSQKWADSSLFADKANLSFLDQNAIRATLEQQKMSELGQSNILSMFGLTQDSEGTMFADLGSTMAGGMKAGAEEGLAEFGRDAIANVVMQLKADSALTEYAALGGEIGGAIWGGVIDSTGSSSIVSAIVTEVLAQINDYLPPD